MVRRKRRRAQHPRTPGHAEGWLADISPQTTRPDGVCSVECAWTVGHPQSLFTVKGRWLGLMPMRILKAEERVLERGENGRRDDHHGHGHTRDYASLRSDL